MPISQASSPSSGYTTNPTRSIYGQALTTWTPTIKTMVGLRYDGDDNRWPMLVKDGDRIAQAKLVPLQRASFEWVEDIAATGRAGGLGHSGV